MRAMTSGESRPPGQEFQEFAPGASGGQPPAFPPQHRSRPGGPNSGAHTDQEAGSAREAPFAPPGGPGTGGPAAMTGGQPPPAGYPGPQGHQPPPGPAGPTQQSRTPRPRRNGLGAGVVALLMLLSLLLGTLLGMVGSRWLFDTDQAAAPDPAPTPTPAPTLDGDGGEGGPDVAAIAEQVLPSTVSIEVRSGSQGFSGSGFVWHEEGYIVTNEHVIAEAEGGDVVVVLPDGGEEVAEVVGSTADYDLAVLQVERDDLTPLAIGDSDQIRVGDPVVAIGAPLGLDGTVTSGIVSALNRPIRVGEEGATFINAIQTDAAINLGNSGGPLVNTGGEVIGVNSAIASQPGQTGSIGLGFSIPSAQVDRTAQQIIDTGQATYPVIGAVLDNSHTGEGVRVLPSSTGGNEPITAGGPAEEAGLNAGDVIVAMDGVPRTSAEELIVLIRAHAPGEVVELAVRQDGQDNSLEVTLGEEVSE